MRCRQDSPCILFHNRVNDLLDERKDPIQDNEIQQHADRCERCREDLKGYQVFGQVLCGPTTVVQRRSSQDQHRPAMTVWLTIATALLIVVTLVQRQRTPAPHIAVGATHARMVQRTNATVPMADLDDCRGNKSSDVVFRQEEAIAGGNFVQPILGLSLVANADWSRMDPVEMPFGVQLPKVETEWIQGVATEMVPIKQSVGRTVSLIMRTLST